MSRTTQTPVDLACQRLRDFMVVTAARPSAERADAIEMFANAAGLSSKQLRELYAHFEKATDDERSVSWAVIGVIVGQFLKDELAK